MPTRRSDHSVTDRIPASPFPVTLALSLAIGAMLAGCSAPLSMAHPPFSIPSDSASCANGGWTPPIEPRLPDGRRVAIHAPNLVRVKTGLAIVGAPTFVWHSATLPVDTGGASGEPALRSPFAGALLRDDGTLSMIPFPPGVTFMTKEFAVSDGKGGMHVVWGIPTFPPAPVRAPTVEIWYAHFDGRRWSAPESVLAAEELVLEHTLSRLRLKDGVLHLAVVGRAPRADIARFYGIAYARRTDGRWQTRWLPLAGLDARYLDMIALGAGRVLLTFVASIPTQQPGDQPNALATMTSSDDGAHWEGPTVVRQLDPWDGFFVHALPDRVGRVHILWTSYPFSTTDVNLRHIASSDAREWSEPSETRLDPSLFALDAALDQSDSLRVLIERSGEPPVVAVATQSGWLPPVQPPIPASYAPPSLSRADGTLYLTSNASELFLIAANRGVNAAWLQISRLTPCTAGRAISTPASRR